MAAREIATVVCWKGCYGFARPQGGTREDDVFVGHRDIDMDGYRALEVGWTVSFVRGADDDGRPKGLTVRVENRAG
jgi:cold shock CspA family protein